MRSAVRFLVVALAPSLVVVASSCAPERARDEPRRAPDANAAPVVPAGRDSVTSARWLLAPEAADDVVRASDSEATLRQRLGDANVRRDTIWLAEGEFVLGTVLYADDRARRLEVQWSDTAARARPELVRVGVGATDSSVWRAAPGVGIGTTLGALERLNGRPFVLSGFGWDYGGTVDSWQGGRLDSLWGDRVTVRLHLRGDGQSALEREVQGDRLFPSSHAAMRALDPRVYDLLVRPR